MSNLNYWTSERITNNEVNRIRERKATKRFFGKDNVASQKQLEYLDILITVSKRLGVDLSEIRTDNLKYYGETNAAIRIINCKLSKLQSAKKLIEIEYKKREKDCRPLD